MQKSDPRWVKDREGITGIFVFGFGQNFPVHCAKSKAEICTYVKFELFITNFMPLSLVPLLNLNPKGTFNFLRESTYR